MLSTGSFRQMLLVMGGEVEACQLVDVKTHLYFRIILHDKFTKTSYFQELVKGI